MRISTAQTYDRPTAQMRELTAQADTLQAQIATGKKVVSASDDAPGWQRLQTLARADADRGADAANVALAQAIVAETDTALQGVEAQLQRANELALQAANGTMSDSQREAVSAELDGILEELFSIANRTDLRGQPLFAGATGETGFVRGEDGTITYAGSGDPAAIPVGDGDTMQVTVAGDRVFGSGSEGSGAFAALAALSAALKAGDTTAIAAAGEDIGTALDQVNATRTSIGARAIRLDLAAQRFETEAIQRAESRSGIEDVDMTTAIADLQRTLTVLQATQASFTRLTQLSLFDYLR